MWRKGVRADTKRARTYSHKFLEGTALVSLGHEISKAASRPYGCEQYSDLYYS